KKIIVLLFICLPILLFLNSCQKEIFGIKYEDTPVGNFEALWNEFDQMYGLFKVRNVDWDQVYDTYRPKVDNSMSDLELYEFFIEVLSTLDDGHVNLIATNPDFPTYTGGPPSEFDFDLDLLKNNYLPDAQENGLSMTYGFLEDGIGYLYILHFGQAGNLLKKEMEELVDFFKDAKGLIVDLRNGYGGEDIAGKIIASHFSDQKRLYMTTSIKNGTGENDFTSPEEWYLEPIVDFPFTKPMVVLTNRVTISARESFLLAMKALPQVTTVGDTTKGAFANAINRDLPNGWGYSMSIGDWRAADGTSYEGKGVPPDVLVENNTEDVLRGKDEALESAIELLR
ncbi:MAG: S41 family peptidase, partial [Bacteroidota bacterium]